MNAGRGRDEPIGRIPGRERQAAALQRNCRGQGRLAQPQARDRRGGPPLRIGPQLDAAVTGTLPSSPGESPERCSQVPIRWGSASDSAASPTVSWR
jgi:hypothetical protein